VATNARDHVKAISDLEQMIPTADVIILTVPLNEKTKGLVDARFLALMKQGALLVNVARGPVVETDALVDALNSGKISAALDVTNPEPLPADHPLWDAPNCLITPHLGGESDIFEPRARTRIFSQLDLWFANRELESIISSS
jgi:phosphoglycerate dehydrogenase-like enzyme